MCASWVKFQVRVQITDKALLSLLIWRKNSRRLAILINSSVTDYSTDTIACINRIIQSFQYDCSNPFTSAVTRATTVEWEAFTVRIENTAKLKVRKTQDTSIGV